MTSAVESIQSGSTWAAHIIDTLTSKEKYATLIIKREREGVCLMANYFREQSGFTIAPGQTLTFITSWQNIPGVGPNQGPVIFAADPRPGQSAEIRLITSDVAKCRNAPTHPNGTEIFYRWSVRNDSSITAVFDVERVWGQRNPQLPW